MKEYYFLEEHRDGWFMEVHGGPEHCRCVHEFYLPNQKGAVNSQRYETHYDEDCINCGGRGVPPIPWSEVSVS